MHSLRPVAWMIVSHRVGATARRSRYRRPRCAERTRAVAEGVGRVLVIWNDLFEVLAGFVLNKSGHDVGRAFAITLPHRHGRACRGHPRLAGGASAKERRRWPEQV